jgi:DNA excision repair protein ERCC-3
MCARPAQPGASCWCALCAEPPNRIYDEVHLLPAPVFRVTAELQARRRLELTATLVREVGREADVFALIIGEYIPQLEALARELSAPLVTGKTPQIVREQLYDRFRRGDVRHLVLSRVGNSAIDLPDADVLIQVSGMFGSRQEETQRRGRILRPKAD